jgi:hypothetical protein
MKEVSRRHENRRVKAGRQAGRLLTQSRHYLKEGVEVVESQHISRHSQEVLDGFGEGSANRSLMNDLIRDPL